MQDFNTGCVRGDFSATAFDTDWVSVWCDMDEPAAVDPMADTALASIAVSGVCESLVVELASPVVALVADESVDAGPGYSAAAWDAAPLMAEDEEEEFEEEDDDFDDDEEEFEDDFEDEDDDFDDDEEDEFEGDDDE